jgi:hypothetical protein
MPDVPDVLMAFVDEHQRCGDLDGGRDGGSIWLTCICGAQIVHPASAPPSAAAAGDSRKSRPDDVDGEIGAPGPH